ncbi:hypothetical protein SAMN04515673_12016 [Poseidonocella sedimentorum]|uniref:Uncharacterized protein n=1 Tax=Poseidonocella sedimentorum TaxID=871652 RepID=A0A1I6ES83_9RHOB|nr:hypothetical protein SAMN04515673_12016 [Poseidonocella sedimentorum]
MDPVHLIAARAPSQLHPACEDAFYQTHAPIMPKLPALLHRLARALTAATGHSRTRRQTAPDLT